MSRKGALVSVYDVCVCVRMRPHTHTHTHILDTDTHPLSLSLSLSRARARSLSLYHAPHLGQPRAEAGKERPLVVAVPVFVRELLLVELEARETARHLRDNPAHDG